jgi:PAS domain S-box-containing protein
MRKPLRVLMVEDSEDDALLTIRALKNGGYDPEYARVETAEAMRKALQERPWDVILCDYQMPKFNGLAAIALLKETGIDIPLIIVSGAIGEETAAECMRSGAHDYVMKGNLARLVPAVERELKEAESRRQRKQAEKALRESEQRYRLLVENTNEAIVVVQDGKAKFANRGIEWAGYTREEYMSIPIMETIHPEDREAVEQRYLKKINGDTTPTRQTYRGLEKSGLIHWIEVSSVLIDWGGQPATLNLITDITERKRTDDDLKEALEKYRSLAAYVDSLYLVDRDCAYLFMNETHLKRFGLSLEEVVGKKYCEFHSEEDAKRLAEDVNEVCQTGNPITKEHRSERDGKYFLRTFTPIIGKDSDGKISQVAVISKEITNIKLAENKLQDTLNSLRRAVNTTIQVMVSAVETRDPYTAGHQIRSANLARTIATEMGLSPEKIDGIRMAGSIHDIGKLSIPAEILSKPTKLSEIEFKLIKEHSRKGYEMLKDVESPWPLAEIVYQHHERMDGSGYPRNLKGEDILIEARILAVTDVVEAMASHRPYRPALGLNAALEEVENNRGIHYDTEVVDACLRLFREKGYLLIKA